MKTFFLICTATSVAVLMHLSVTTVSGALSIDDNTVERYHGNSVFRVKAKTEEQLLALYQIEDEVDFWRQPSRALHFADVMVKPENKDKILHYLQHHGIEHKLIINDVEQLIERERNEMAAIDQQLIERSPFKRLSSNYSQRDVIPDFFLTYQRYDQHVALVNALESQNSNIVKKISIGNTYQKRDIFAIVIGEDPGGDTKPIIWIEGGNHAREWISPATVSYFAQQLVNKYNDKDATVVDLLKTFDFYIVPLLNADGYEFSHTNSRLWRKTRQPSSSTCIGADPNRNFGYQWGGQGASTNPCSDTYRGASAYSEPEIKAECDYIYSIGSRVKSFLSIHSYGQYILYPWGYTSTSTKDDSELNRVAKVAVNALNEVSPNIRYTIGQSTNVLYAAAGGADDWAYGNSSITFSYTIELRDTGTYGFQLPASQIIPSGDETSAAFIALAQEVKKKLYTNSYDESYNFKN